MRVTVEIEIGEIGNRFRRAVGRHLACTYEAPEGLGYLDVHQVGRMPLVLASNKAGLDAGAKPCLQEEFQQGLVACQGGRTDEPVCESSPGKPVVDPTTARRSAITNGIPRSMLSYAHLLCEDPVRGGLLYLGTENAIHVPFDDGENRQPLQNNLPHVAVYGIVV
jgi:hypothetical protein